MQFSKASTFVVLVICLATCQAQLPPGIIPIPDAAAPVAPAALTAAATPAIAAPAPAAAVPPARASFPAAFPAAAPAAAHAAFPAAGAGFPAAAPAAMPAAAPAAFPAAAPAAFPAAAPAAFPAAAGFPAGAAPAAAAFPAAAAPVAPPAALPLGFAGHDPLAAAGYPSAAAAAAQPAAPQPGYAMPAAGAMPGMAGPAAALPAVQYPTGETVISVPPVGGAAAAGTAPGSLAGAFAAPTLPPGLLPASVNSMAPAPPPRARPAAPPAPPIPRGAAFKPQWDELKEFTDNDTIVSFNVANTPEQIYWNQKKVREALAKAGGILPDAISYYQVLPSADQYGRAFTTIRFVVANRNAALATNLLASLNEQKTQNNLKNRIEELHLDMIGNSMTAQTPTEYKAAARGSSGPLPSATTMDTTGGLNSVAAAGGTGFPGPAGVAPLPGTAAAGGNATSTVGLPGLPAGGGMATTLAERRRQNSGTGSVAAAGALLPLLLAAGALLL